MSEWFKRLIDKKEQVEETPKEDITMGDMKFTTAGQYMDSIEEQEYIYPGKDCQI